MRSRFSIRVTGRRDPRQLAHTREQQHGRDTARNAISALRAYCSNRESQRESRETANELQLRIRDVLSRTALLY